MLCKISHVRFLSVGDTAVKGDSEDVPVPVTAAAALALRAEGTDPESGIRELRHISLIRSSLGRPCW